MEGETAEGEDEVMHVFWYSTGSGISRLYARKHSLNHPQRLLCCACHALPAWILGRSDSRTAEGDA